MLYLALIANNIRVGSWIILLLCIIFNSVMPNKPRLVLTMFGCLLLLIFMPTTQEALRLLDIALIDIPLQESHYCKEGLE